MSVDRPADDAGGHRWSRYQRIVLRARRLQLVRSSLIALVAMLIGVGLGRWSVPDADPDVRATVERSVQPLALDADAIWTSVDEHRPAIAEGVSLVRRGKRLDDVRTWTVEWLSAYDNALVRLTGLELRPEARPVQRQFVSAVTLSRDAVEVLQQATQVEDPGTRQLLVAEALRLRRRAEHLTQGARASVRDLSGGKGEVSQHPSLPAFDTAGDGG